MSLDKSAFSERFNDALAITAIVDEMLRADNWQGIDECLAIKPELIKTFTRYAEAALRAMKRIEENDLAQIRPN
ncbi:MAG TPA: hypothetical protein VMV79_04875 [Alphaproteobacteria bacterium]|nr:hypothetical protein [Alphaproteobacteria bacterium]